MRDKILVFCYLACAKTRKNETKRPQLNHRNERNETTEMTETSETTKTSKMSLNKWKSKKIIIIKKKRKRSWSLSRCHGSPISQPDLGLWYREITDSLRACKDGWAQARRARRHREKGKYLSYFKWHKKKKKKSNFWKRFPGRIMDSYAETNGLFEKDFAAFLVRTKTFFISREGEDAFVYFYHSGVCDSFSSQSIVHCS